MHIKIAININFMLNLGNVNICDRKFLVLLS